MSRPSGEMARIVFGTPERIARAHFMRSGRLMDARTGTAATGALSRERVPRASAEMLARGSTGGEGGARRSAFGGGDGALPRASVAGAGTAGAVVANGGTASACRLTARRAITL